METVLDPTYLRPGIVTRGTVIGLVALAVGAGVFLACFGLSYLWHSDKKLLEHLDAINAKLETIANRPDRIDEVIKKIDDLGSGIAFVGEGFDKRLVAIEKKVAPIITGGPPVPSHDNHGNVIIREVTVFWNTEHEGGNVVTGWRYPDGASANQAPTSQYCYWSSGSLGGTSAEATIHIATNGVRLVNIANGVPQLNEAFQKCRWWSGAGQ
jgi:hypothetical protein